MWLSCDCHDLTSAWRSAQHLAHSTCSANTSFYYYLPGRLLYSRKRYLLTFVPAVMQGAALTELSPAGERNSKHTSRYSCHGTLGHSYLDRSFSEEVTFKWSP